MLKLKLIRLLKNPKTIFIGLIIIFIVSFTSFLKYQNYKLTKLQDKLNDSEDKVLVLESINEANNKKFQDIKDDLDNKDKILNKIRLEKKTLTSQYKTLEGELNSLLESIYIEDGVNTISIQERINQTVNNSLNCLQVATGNDGVQCE